MSNTDDRCKQMVIGWPNSLRRCKRMAKRNGYCWQHWVEMADAAIERTKGAKV